MYVPSVSNHFTGLSLGPPLGDQRLDLCDLYAFQSPTNPDRTVLILNANPNADALHPDAIYRLAVDNDGDLLNDIAFSYVFSAPTDGKQTVDVYMATGEQAREVEAVGTKILSDVPVSFVGDEPYIATSGDITFFAGARSDAFFFDYDGIKNLFDTSGQRNFTDLHLGDESPWTGVDSNTEANVFSTVIELPTSQLGANPGIRVWGRCSVRKDGQLEHVDRRPEAGDPSEGPEGHARRGHHAVGHHPTAEAPAAEVDAHQRPEPHLVVEPLGDEVVEPPRNGWVVREDRHDARPLAEGRLCRPGPGVPQRGWRREGVRGEGLPSPRH